MMVDLLTLDNVSVHYPVFGGVLRRAKRWVRAVDEVSLSIASGQTLGLVGESGCGKSTLGRAVLGLRDLTGGTITFAGDQMATMTEQARRALRRDMQLIFQDPYASLDPRATIGSTIRAGLDIHGIGTRAERARLVTETMRQVGLDPSLADRYPHEFSGGMRQRVVMARALVLRPRLVVCDEPTSALDVSIQSQILNLLKDLQQDLGLTYLFISHNLAVVEHMADHVAVMYLGRIVEIAPRAELFASPRHPYTQALIRSIPQPDPRHRNPPAIAGDLPSPDDLPSGCRFRGRCPYAMGTCATAEPPLLGGPHKAACWLMDKDHTQ